MAEITVDAATWAKIVAGAPLRIRTEGDGGTALYKLEGFENAAPRFRRTYTTEEVLEMLEELRRKRFGD